MTDDAITLRKATASDAEALASVGSEAFSVAYAKFNTPENIAAHLREYYAPVVIRREMELPDRFYLLALVEDEPAGLCKLCKGAVPDAIPDPASLEIQQLYIHPAHQRRGIGKTLVDAAVREARSSGLSGVWLGVWEKAEWAIDFYSNYGFHEFGSHSFLLASSRQTDLLMWMSTLEA